MSFTSFEFIIFFVIILIFKSFLRNAVAEKWLLLIAGICFYLSWSIAYVIIIIFISIFDFCIGNRLGETENQKHRKILLIISLATNIGLLAFFKYSNFLIDNIWFILNFMGLHFNKPYYDISLPPAISYFTFASMSYIVDVYYEKISPCKSVRDYSVFITFFPKLLSGPIARAINFLPQLKQNIKTSALDIETGMVYILVGAVKKLVISDQIANNINIIFATPSQYDGFTLLQGLLGYTIQIYCDFSGYSDMAIGLALILGYKLPENFQMPYSSITISEFWRRWHITLSTWIRDYIFIPREMATRDYKNTTVRTSINMMLTMLLCGLWHGAGWNFIIWGGIHGLALSIHKIWMDWNPLVSLEKYNLFDLTWRLISRILTLSVIVFAWIFFRAESFNDAIVYIVRMMSWAQDGTRMISPNILPAVVAIFIVHIVFNKDHNWMQEIPHKSMILRIIAYAFLFTLLVCFGASDSVPFIYLQF